MRRLALFCGLVVAMMASPVLAEEPIRGLTGGTIHIGDGQVTQGGDVFWSAEGQIGAASGGRTLDVTGKVVTPGFIDLVSGLGMIEIEAVDASSDANGGGDRIRSAFLAADAFNPNSAVIPIMRPGGVTSALLIPRGGLIRGRSAWINLGGQGTFGRVVQTPVAMHMALGESGGRSAGGSRGGALLRLREIFDDVRHYRDNKKAYDEGRSRKLKGSRLDLEALVPVAAGKMPVFIAAHRASDILAALALAKAQGFSPIIQGGAEAWMVADALAAAKVPVVLNPLLNLPVSFEALGARADNAALLHEAGVTVIIATFSAHDTRQLRQFAGNAVRAGLPHDVALRALTSAPAEAVGMGGRYGSLKAGRMASVAVWSGDPFEFSSRVEHLFIDGREVSLDHRQKRLMEKYRTLPRRADPAPAPE